MILNFVAPVRFLPLAVSLVVGIPLLIVGIGLFLWAQVTIFRGDENPAPHKATARDEYREYRSRVRHLI